MMLTRFFDISRIVLLICLLPTSKILVDTAAGRCYLCSQNTLAECVGSTQTNSNLFNTVLQYYTEPCNGQCVLFRNERSSTVRGCSWTYGHMTPKSTGWHDLSPGIRAYFCDSYLCNNGTYEQPEGTPMIPLPIEQGNVLLNPVEPINPQQMFLFGGQTTPDIRTHLNLPIINEISRQLRQCYVCTSRQMGCAEYLDPRFASKYIQPCPSSCIVFRNPTDHNLMTRDCASAWPDVHAKSGLHKILGSDAFFCQESLCNGIGFDFVMGIFHNQLPAVITFPPTESIIDDSTTILVNPIDLMTTSSSTIDPIDETSPIVTEEDNVVWEDPELDFVMVEATTSVITSITTTPPISSSTPPLFVEFPIDGIEFEYQSTTVPFEHFEFFENIPASSTIAGGAAIAEDNSQLNWWEIDDMTFPPTTEPISSSSTIIPLNNNNNNNGNDDDDWAVFNTTSIPTSTISFNMNDLFPFPFDSSTPSLNFFNSDNSLFDLDKPSPTFAIPPFAWMLHLATQNQTQLNSTMKMKLKQKKTIDVKKIFAKDLDRFHDYCHNKRCQHGGRLNADCLCICLPAFSGNNCERVNCEKEPAHICDFVLEDECKNESIRYLCPKFCQLNLCSSDKSS